jgi:acyl-CoA dehydrogenase
MNFEFSEDQLFLRDQASRFLVDQCPPRLLRNIFETDKMYADNLWQQITDLGWTAITIPEEYGGLGLGQLELCIIAEQLGRVLAPIPFASSVYLATDLLNNFGTKVLKDRYLPQLATKGLIGTVAITEHAGQLIPAANSLLDSYVDNGKIYGCKVPVADGAIADIAIVLAASAKNGDCNRLYLVDLNQQSVLATTLESVDPSRNTAIITFSGAEAIPLATSESAAIQLQKTYQRAAVAIAFEQLGGAEAAFNMSKNYAMQRYTFGRVIASYQGMRNKLVGIYADITLARGNCYFGAWAASTDDDELPLAAAAARISASKAYYHASKENIQIHGGMGYTWEMDCHFYYRRAKWLAVLIGSERYWKNHLVDQLSSKLVDSSTRV